MRVWVSGGGGYWPRYKSNQWSSTLVADALATSKNVIKNMLSTLHYRVNVIFVVLTVVVKNGFFYIWNSLIYRNKISQNNIWDKLNETFQKYHKFQKLLCETNHNMATGLDVSMQYSSLDHYNLNTIPIWSILLYVLGDLFLTT